ncbi:MAG: glycosyltransferase [Candidatus Pacearchaeota archaeon]
MEKELPFFSFVVPTYNRKENLRKCLSNIMKVDYPKKNYEIIIVDDGSTDRTEEVIRNLLKKRKNIKYIKQENSGPAKARNKGIKNSKGEIIFFVDDDVLINKDIVKKSLEWYKNQNVVGVGGNVLPIKLSWPDLYYIARYLDEYMGVTKLEKEEKEKGLSTALCSYRRKVLKEVKGFNENFPFAAGEDIDLTQRILKKDYIVIKDPSIKGEHLRSENFISVIKLKFKRMSGAIIHKGINRNLKTPYKFSRIFEQWKNLKKTKKIFLKEKVCFIDFIKFCYLTIALAIASKIGEIYFKIKLKKKL